MAKTPDLERRQELLDRIVDAGGQVPAGWALEEVRAVSVDGRTFAGNGLNPSGHSEAFRVVFQAPL